jgi:hypothetical protein
MFKVYYTYNWELDGIIEFTVVKEDGDWFCDDNGKYHQRSPYFFNDLVEAQDFVRNQLDEVIRKLEGRISRLRSEEYRTKILTPKPQEPVQF